MQSIKCLNMIKKLGNCTCRNEMTPRSKKWHCVPISEMHWRKRFCLSFNSVQTNAHTKVRYIGLCLLSTYKYRCIDSTWNVKSVTKFSHHFRNQYRSWCWILDILSCWWFSWTRSKIQLINTENAIIFIDHECLCIKSQSISFRIPSKTP